MSSKKDDNEYLLKTLELSTLIFATFSQRMFLKDTSDPTPDENAVIRHYLERMDEIMGKQEKTTN